MRSRNLFLLAKYVADLKWKEAEHLGEILSANDTGYTQLELLMNWAENYIDTEDDE